MIDFKVPWKCGPGCGDREERTFRITIADTVEAGKMFDRPNLFGLDQRWRELRFEDLPKMLWLGLRWEDPELTPEDIEKWEFSVEEAREKFLDAWCRTMYGRTHEENVRHNVNTWAEFMRGLKELRDAGFGPQDAEEDDAGDPLGS